MLFKNEEASLQLEAVNYEFPPDGGAPESDDRNWLVFRATYKDGDGLLIKDSNSCLLTYELREMAAGLKVLRAGIKRSYGSDFVEPYFALSARTEDEEHFTVDVAFALPNTMEDIDSAELQCVMTREELSALIDELDGLCAKFPDRT